MDDRRGDDHADRDRRHRDDRNGRGRPNGAPDSDREDWGREGSDTRFLQLEMSRVLYTEAEGVTKQALRELLLDAAKVRLREQFGETITRLAQLAIDELLADIEASLDVEGQIQRRRESHGGRDRLREALARKQSDRSQPSAERKEGRASRSRRARR